MQQTKIEYNLDGLESLMKEIGGDYVARVGILEGKAQEQHIDTDYTNGQIGVVHEMGSETNNIPSRSFLRLPIELKEKDIMKAMGGKTVTAAIEAGQIKTAYSLLGVIAEGYVKQAFASKGYGQWEALKQATIDAKGSSTPLIDSGQLRRSISSDVIRKKDLS